jgi:hypothetical protein
MDEARMVCGCEREIPMIEMKCPACGAEGRAPKDKINTRLVCKKCLRVFHLTPSGRAVIGEPPQPVVAPVKAPDPTEKFELALNFEWLGGIKKLVTSPKVLAVVGGLIVVAAGYMVVSLFHSESLETRASRIAKATVKGELSTLLELSSTGTSDDIVKWFIAIQPQCVEIKKAMTTAEPAVDVVINKEDAASGTADVVARVASEEALSKHHGNKLPDMSISTFADRVYELPLVFISEGLEGWRLDGKRTLEAMPKTSLMKLETH